MAGEFSRVGNQRALGIAMSGTSGVLNPGMTEATVSTGWAVGATVTAPAVTALAKALPSGAVVMFMTTTGTQVEVFTLSAAAASGATALAVTSQVASKVRAVGDLCILIQFAPYIALTTTAPTDAALGTEYAATGYARQPVALTVPTAADPPQTQNSAQMTYGPFTAGTGGVIGYAELMDAASGGAATNMGAWWTLTSTRTPAVNDSVQIAAAALTMTCL